MGPERIKIRSGAATALEHQSKQARKSKAKGRRMGRKGCEKHYPRDRAIKGGFRQRKATTGYAIRAFK